MPRRSRSSGWIYGWSVKDADAIVVGIGDVNQIFGIDEDSVGARQFAALAVARDRGDDAAFVDASDGMVLGVRDVETSVRGQSHTLGARESRLAGVAAVAGKAFFAGAGEPIQLAGFHVEAIDGVALTQGKIVGAGFVDCESAGAIERSAFQRRPIGSGAFGTGSRRS